jgi:capsular exopolysaccharide synthesis family protein
VENEILDQAKTGTRVTPKELLFKYLAYLPLFIVSVVVCTAAGIMYSRYTKPLYKASAKVLVKGEDNNRRIGGSSDLIDNALTAKRINLDNEIELIRSRSIMEPVVYKNGYNINYYHKGNILDLNVYKSAPVQFTPVFIPDSSKSFQIYVDHLTGRGGTVRLSEKAKGIPFAWEQSLNLGGWRFMLRQRGIGSDGSSRFKIIWTPIDAAAAGIVGGIAVSMINAKATIMQLSITTDNVVMGQDILSSLIDEYNLQSVDEKNKVSQNTIAFINERLGLVTSELTGVESNLANYRGKNQIYDVGKQSELYFGNVNQYRTSIQQLTVQDKVARMIYDYVSQPNNNNRPVPSNLGVEDATLTALIGRYNDLQLKKERETPLVTGNSLALEDISRQIEDIRLSILENLRNISKNLNFQVADLKIKSGESQAYLSSLPQKERTLQEINRQRGVQEGLYLYLLQKREEAAISSASTVSNYKMIDRPAGSGMPVEPNVSNIRLYSAIFGFVLAFAIIFLRDMMNDKVSLRTDITKVTEAPIVGEVAHFKDKERQLVITNKDRGVIAEQFRILRANLQFITRNRQSSVMMVTSTVPGEGKTFCSMNLAAVYAVTGKKTVILELDLRKPKISKSLNLKAASGLTSYIMGMATVEEIIVPIASTENLYLIPAGLIPPNPSEMLLDKKMDDLFVYLRQQFEYIIIDTAPVGLVSDAKILSRLTDATVYIVRQRFTVKKQLAFIDDLYTKETLPNMALLVNDVKIGGANSYYGYGYGYGYGYSYNYGYNYSYGDEQKMTIWKKIRQSVNL